MPSLNTLSRALIIISDSTGIEPSRAQSWPTRLLTKIAEKFSNHAVVFSWWNDAAQSYEFAQQYRDDLIAEHVVIAANDGQARTRILANGKIEAFTDLDLEVDVSLSEWRPSSARSLCGQWGSAGTYGHRIQVLTTGALRYMWSNDGTAQLTANSTVVLPALDGERYKVRVTHDVNNGAAGNTVTFWYAKFGQSAWTQLGAPLVTAGVTSIFRPAARDFELGGTGSSTTLVGRYYAAIWRNGIGGAIISPQSIASWTNNEDRSPLAGAPTIYVFIGAQGGAGINPSAGVAGSGFLEATRFPRMMPSCGVPTTVLLNTGHNEIDNGPDYAIKLDDWLTASKARLPLANHSTMTQNPRGDGITPRHRARMGILRSWSQRNAVPMFDCYSIFPDAELATLLQPDLIHPSSLGCELMASEIGGARLAELLAL